MRRGGWFHWLAAACFVTGLWQQVCAAQGNDSQPLKIGQVGTGPAVQYAACNGDCMTRTPKVVALASPPPAVTAPSLSATSPSRMLTVHFRLARADLDAAGREEVRAVVAGLGHYGRLVVLGRTDPTGPYRLNYTLALRRAKTVRTALISAGVPAAQVRAMRHEPCCEGDRKVDTDAMAKLRRADVDIVITGN